VTHRLSIALSVSRSLIRSKKECRSCSVQVAASCWSHLGSKGCLLPSCVGLGFFVAAEGHHYCVSSSQLIQALLYLAASGASQLAVAATFCAADASANSYLDAVVAICSLCDDVVAHFPFLFCFAVSGYSIPPETLCVNYWKQNK